MVRESSGYTLRSFCLTSSEQSEASSAAGPEAQTGTSLSREAANVPT